MFSWKASLFQPPEIPTIPFDPMLLIWPKTAMIRPTTTKPISTKQPKTPHLPTSCRAGHLRSIPASKEGWDGSNEVIGFMWGCLNQDLYLTIARMQMDELYLPADLLAQKTAEQNLPNSDTNFSDRNKNNDHNSTPRNTHENSPQHIYELLESNEKVIPGYNFESLFRKKSHIRLARKKAKEETQKKNPHLKLDPTQTELKNIQKGHWTNEENKLYHWFLELHNRHFVLKYLRRTDKIFKSMANFIRTREAEQCRSHHQKMEKKYHTFYQILAKLRLDFYGTTTTDLLKIELEENGYKVKQNTLITEAEIRNGDLMVRDCRLEEFEDSLGNACAQQSREERNHSNILGQNYEHGLPFANMHY